MTRQFSRSLSGIQSAFVPNCTSPAAILQLKLCLRPSSRAVSSRWSRIAWINGRPTRSYGDLAHHRSCSLNATQVTGRVSEGRTIRLFDLESKSSAVSRTSCSNFVRAYTSQSIDNTCPDLACKCVLSSSFWLTGYRGSSQQ